jgi:hypothetical protein
MPKKSVKKRKASSSKKTTGGRKDVVGFVDHLEKSRELRSKLRKTWNDVIAAGKKKGFKFTREDLRKHFKQRYGVTTYPGADKPDTCICI